MKIDVTLCKNDTSSNVLQKFDSGIWNFKNLSDYWSHTIVGVGEAMTGGSKL